MVVKRLNRSCTSVLGYACQTRMGRQYERTVVRGLVLVVVQGCMNVAV